MSSALLATDISDLCTNDKLMMQIRSSGHFSLPMGVNMRVNGCLFLR